MEKKDRRYTILAVFLGFMALMTGLSIYGFVFGIAGIWLSVIAIKKYGKHTGATIGIVLSVLGILLSLLALSTLNSDDNVQNGMVDNSTTSEVSSAETTKETTTAESTSESVKTEYHIYNNAFVKPVMNGFRTEKLGEYSIIEIPSSDITLDDLSDWYFNYVEKNDFNFCIIIYTDKEDNSGVYSANGIVEKDVVFSKDEYGDYSISEADAEANATFYIPSENGTLSEFSVEE